MKVIDIKHNNHTQRSIKVVEMADDNGGRFSVVVHPGKPVYGVRLDIQTRYTGGDREPDKADPEFGWVEYASAEDKPYVIAALSAWAASALVDYLVYDRATDVHISYGENGHVLVTYNDGFFTRTMLEADISFISYWAQPDETGVVDMDVLQTELNGLVEAKLPNP